MPNLNVNGIRCAGVLPNPEISYTNAGASTLFSIITVPGNLLVLVVVLRNPTGKLRSPFNWFILNLALADLLVGLLVEPLSALVHVREGLRYELKYHHYLRPIYFTSCTASVFSLGMLTIDRYIAITSPIKYRATLSNSRAAISSCVIWIISIALPFLRDKIGFLWYFFVFGNASVLLTFFVLLFAFVRVHLQLRAQIRELERIQNHVQNNAMKTEARITKTFMLMLIAFMLSYTPSLIMIYLMNFCTICSCQVIHWFRDLSFIFVVSNSCINPFLYAWRLPNFNEAIRALFVRNPHEGRSHVHLQGVYTSRSSWQPQNSISTARSSIQVSGDENYNLSKVRNGTVDSYKQSPRNTDRSSTASPSSITSRGTGDPGNTAESQINSTDHLRSPIATHSDPHCGTDGPRNRCNSGEIYTKMAVVCEEAHVNPVVGMEPVWQCPNHEVQSV